MASVGLDTYKVGFDSTVHRTVEVKGGLLRPYVRVASGDLYRNEGVYQRMSGGGLPGERTNRFGDSPVSQSDYSRRRVKRKDYEDGQFVDWSDVSRMAFDPRHEKLDIMLGKFRRNEDIIITQGLLGTAKGGDNGETNVDLASGQVVDVTIGALSGDTNAGFNYEKLMATIESFGSAGVDIVAQSPTVVISWKQWLDIRKDDKFINADYTTFRTDGGIGFWNYMGIQFIVSNIVPFMNTAGTGVNVDSVSSTAGTFTDANSTDIRACFAFLPQAGLLEINPDITTKIAERADKGFNWYAYIAMSLGSVRMEEELVRVIPCDQSP
jgi:hypothetical protein